MEGEIRQKTMKDRCVIGSLARIIKGRNISMEIKSGLRNSQWCSGQHSGMGA